MIRLPQILGWLLAFGLLANAHVARSLVIDTFETDLKTTVLAPSTVASNWVTGGAGIVGSERYVRLTLTSGSGIDADIAGGVLAYEQLSSSEGTAMIQWDGPDGSSSLDPTGLGGLDFTDAGVSSGLALSLLSNDLAAQIILTVYTDAVNFSQAVANLPGDIPPDPQQVLGVPFADFTVAGGTGVDFTNVGAMIMTIDGSSTAGLDFSLDLIETNIVPVPEPSTSALIIGGLIALAWSARRGRFR